MFRLAEWAAADCCGSSEMCRSIADAADGQCYLPQQGTVFFQKATTGKNISQIAAASCYIAGILH